MSRAPLPPPTEPAIDVETGQWTHPWYRYFSQQSGDLIESMPKGFFRVDLNSTKQTVVSSQTTTVLAFNHEVYDTDLWYDTTTFSYTPQESGYYHLYCAAGTTRNADGYAIEPLIFKNTSIEAAGTYIQPVTTTNGGSQGFVDTIVYINGTTDSIKFGVTCPSTLVDGNVVGTYAYGYKIGST